MNIFKNIFCKAGTIVCAVLLCFALGTNPVQAQEKGIAAILSIEHKPNIKSIGAWETLIQNGLPIYSGDKIFTGNGSLRIMFSDGSILTIMPHSIIRLVEYETLRRRHIKNRELRLLMGKIQYESHERSRAQVKIIFPSGVYPVSEGITVLSHHNNNGTGYETVVFASKKGSGIMGEVKTAANEKAVPDISPEPAGKDPNYQITRAAIESMRIYLNKKQDLEQFNNDNESDMYFKKSRTDRATLYDRIESQRIEDRSVHYAYQQHLALSGKLGDYAQAALRELISENTAYSANPDDRIAAHAKQSVTQAQAARQKLKELELILSVTREDLEAQHIRFENADKAQDKTILSYLMIATLETCSTNEKIMYIEFLLMEAGTVGTQALKEAVEFLSPYLTSADEFGRRFFLEDLNPLVKMVLESQLADDKTAKTAQTAKRKKDQAMEKVIKLIQLISNTTARYSGMINLLVNAHEAYLFDENPSFVEEELFPAIKAWIAVFDIYRNFVTQFKILDVERLNTAVKSLIEQAEKNRTRDDLSVSFGELLNAIHQLTALFEAYNNAVALFETLNMEKLNRGIEFIVRRSEVIESSDLMFINFLSEYLRLSAVLSPKVSNGYQELASALILHVESGVKLTCLKCEEYRQIKQQQMLCLDPPECFKCNPQRQLVPDDGAFCDDGDPCTKNDRCLGGVCRGVRVSSAEDPNCR